MNMVEHTGRRGRPSKYRPILNRIQLVNGHDWHVIDRQQKRQTQPSELRKRYPGFDFKCEPNGHGKFNLLARWVGEVGG
jgi:hypothetical protein